VASRYGQAGQPDWRPPDDGELSQHFAESFLARRPADELASSLTPWARALRQELTVLLDRQIAVRAQLGRGVQIEARAESQPPHRLTAMRMYRVGDQVHDDRLALASTRTSGAVPAAAAEVAETAFAELGLPGLILAGDDGYGRAWIAARGWADLDRAEVLSPGHRFPVGWITMLVTATAVLRLAADGRLDLDDPANDHLRTVRLADDAITVRQLLTRTSGIGNPSPLFAETVPDLVALTGPVLASTGERGVVASSHGGYAALGQLIADVTGLSYPDAAARLVLEPLGMAGSAFPARWPDTGAVTGYTLDLEGSFEPGPRNVCTVQASGGLWATAGDLVRFGLGWASLLPGELAREALRPQADPVIGATRVGLGWAVNTSIGAAGHAGRVSGTSASLVTRLGSGRVYVALANRAIPVEPVNGRVIRATAGPDDPPLGDVVSDRSA